MAHIGYDDASKVWFHLSHALKGSLAQHIRQPATNGKHGTGAKSLIKRPEVGQLAGAAAHVAGNYVAIAELQGRVTILGKDNSIVAQVGDNPNASQRANFGLEPAQWTGGVCNSPHAVVFDRAGNLVVSEWSKFGRVLLFTVKR